MRGCADVRRQVLAADPGCVKGLYRRAQAHLGQQDFVEAELDIRAALQVCILLPCRLYAMRTHDNIAHFCKRRSSPCVCSVSITCCINSSGLCQSRPASLLSSEQ